MGVDAASTVCIFILVPDHEQSFDLLYGHADATVWLFLL